jgi:glycosidase
MYETLRNVTSRNYPARNITYAWQQLNGIEDHMLNFMENHDEHRIASGFFAGDGSYAQPAMIVAATLTKAPVMIYFGQELGELGMDNEGYSGLDGKTTIFDYWGVKSVQAWANNGKFDGEKLTAEQKELRQFYQKLLNITLQEKAITEGVMYDLEYANFNNPHFDTHEQFAYIRKFKDEMLLVVLNFDDKELYTEVRIPLEAFQFLELMPGCQYKAVNLLDEVETIEQITLIPDMIFKISIPAWKGKIFKFKKL